MMKTLQFGGTFRLDPGFIAHRGHIEAERVQQVAEREFAPLKDEDVDLVYRYLSARDFDVYHRDILEGTSKNAEGKQKRHFSERMHGNPFIATVTAYAAGILSLIGLVSKDAREMRNESWKLTHFRTESVDSFLKRSFKAIKADIDATKPMKN